MVETLQLNPATQSGLPLFGVWTDVATGNVWNGSAFVSYTDAAYILGAVACTEQGTTASYRVSDPATVTTKDFIVAVYLQAGGSPDVTDLAVAPLGTGQNVTVSPIGLNVIPVTDPVGVAATLPNMIVQSWRRYFKKTVLDTNGNTIKTYRDDGSTVETTQSATNSGGVQTQGAAS